jgi:acetolactate synthase regulatory subunit
MKQKLTLTVESEIVHRAKKMARHRGVSVSQMFEEAFSTYEVNPIETTAQKAAKSFLSMIEDMETTQPLDDSTLRTAHLKEKYG